MGKKVVRKNGPRCIDLDLLFYAGQVLREGDVRVPHQEAHTRDFVLLPLLEIAPDFVHPVMGQTVRELSGLIDEKFHTGQTHE